MISDLEAEKAVDSSKCLGIVSGQSQLRTALGILGLKCDFAFQTPCGQSVAVAEVHALIDLADCGSMRQGKLAARLQLEKSTISRLVRQMEAHGWIQRNSDRHDGRAVLIRLKRQGREKATELARARQEKFARILAAIPEDKRSMVVEAISILERACS